MLLITFGTFPIVYDFFSEERSRKKNSFLLDGINRLPHGRIMGIFYVCSDILLNKFQYKVRVPYYLIHI